MGPNHLIHLKFDNQAVLSNSLYLGLPNPSDIPNAAAKRREKPQAIARSSSATGYASF